MTRGTPMTSETSMLMVLNWGIKRPVFNMPRGPRQGIPFPVGELVNDTNRNLDLLLDLFICWLRKKGDMGFDHQPWNYLVVTIVATHDMFSVDNRFQGFWQGPCHELRVGRLLAQPKKRNVEKKNVEKFLVELLNWWESMKKQPWDSWNSYSKYLKNNSFLPARPIFLIVQLLQFPEVPSGSSQIPWFFSIHQSALGPVSAPFTTGALFNPPKSTLKMSRFLGSPIGIIRF